MSTVHRHGSAHGPDVNFVSSVVRFFSRVAFPRFRVSAFPRFNDIVVGIVNIVN